MNVQGNGSQQTDDFNTTLDQFVRRYSRARRGLWAANGRIVELGAAIEYDFAARGILIKRLQQVDGVKGSKNFKPSEMDPEQLLLILALGYGEKTKSLRSQYLKTIRKFKETGLERTEAAFVEWVADEGGQRNAAKSAAEDQNSDDTAPQGAPQGDDRGSSGSKGPKSGSDKGFTGIGFKFHSNVMSLRKRSHGLPMVDAKLPDDLFVGNAAALVLAIKDLDKDGVERIKLIPVVQDEAMVSEAVAQAARDQSASFKEAALIHWLNDYALGHERAPSFDGEISSDRAIKFRSVFEKLKGNPKLCPKYGLESAEVRGLHYCNDGHKDNGTVVVVNPDFHPYDPGRFIDGIEPGILVPYSLDGSIEQIQQAAIAYDQDFRAWKATWRKPNKAMDSSHGSMAVAEHQSVSEPKEDAGIAQTSDGASDAGDGDLVASTVKSDIAEVTGEDNQADNDTGSDDIGEPDDAAPAVSADGQDDTKAEVICPLLSGPESVLDLAMKEERNGKEAQAGRDHRQAA